MREIVTLLFAFIVTLAFGQNNLVKNNDSNVENSLKRLVVIDNDKYLIDSISFKSVNPKWIKKIEVLKEESEKYIFGNSTGSILIFPKRRYREDFFQIINRLEDTLVCLNVDTYPKFEYANCKSTIESIKKYFKQHYKMPEILLDNGYVGKIYVQFIVEKNGTLSNVFVVRGIEKPIDESVKEFVKEMSPWIPATLQKKKVRYKYVMPIDIRWLYGAGK
jgi:hypothetical protein